MSDLFCPATLILARHGEAGTLADRLRTRRVAHVYTSPLAVAAQTAQTVATTLDRDVSTRDGLQDCSPEESDDAVVARLRPVVEELSDLYRGETVLVVTHGDLIRRGVRRLARMAPGIRPDPVGPGGTVEIQVDADGILCSAWDPGIGAGD